MPRCTDDEHSKAIYSRHTMDRYFQNRSKYIVVTLNIKFANYYALQDIFSIIIEFIVPKKYVSIFCKGGLYLALPADDAARQ